MNLCSSSLLHVIGVYFESSGRAKSSWLPLSAIANRRYLFTRLAGVTLFCNDRSRYYYSHQDIKNRAADNRQDNAKNWSHNALALRFGSGIIQKRISWSKRCGAVGNQYLIWQRALRLQICYRKNRPSPFI